MARTMACSIPVSSGSDRRDMPPMSEMNTTPLIDVMLVLLIIFIITVPMQSHEVEVPLPKPGPAVIINP